MHNMNRRSVLGIAGAAGLAAWGSSTYGGADEPQPAASRRTRIAVSTYSFWQFNNKSLRDILTCIDLASEWGFDGVEILEMQMEDKSNSMLQRIKQRAFVNGMDLCGFSTHQGWVSPSAEERQKNTDKTIHRSN